MERMILGLAVYTFLILWIIFLIIRSSLKADADECDGEPLCFRSINDSNSYNRTFYSVEKLFF